MQQEPLNDSQEPGSASLTGSILVVDDDRYIGSAVSKMLSEAGADVDQVDSASNALESLNERAADVVITDLVMNDADGFQLLKEIHAIDNSISVIIMTSHANPDLESKASAIGANGFLRKPFDSSTCVQAAAEALNLRRKKLGLS